MSNTKTSYIIGPIGDPDSSQRKWADFVRKHIIEPTVTDCGYEKPARADDADTGLIVQDIIKQMFEADLVVADLTDQNGNVYYEVGIRHCAQKPAIHLIKEGQKPLFDLGTNKAIFIGTEHLIVEKAKEDIKKRIKAIEKKPDEFYSHVHMHIQLKQLKIFEKSNLKINESMLNLLERMLSMSGKTGEQLNMLIEELVLGPKRILTQHPTLAYAADSSRLGAGGLSGYTHGLSGLGAGGYTPLGRVGIHGVSGVDAAGLTIGPQLQDALNQTKVEEEKEQKEVEEEKESDT